jgi:hypothetical protein
MRNGQSILAYLAVLAIAASAAPGNILNTRTGSSYTTVQAAVNGAANGDTIEIDGTYTGSAAFASISKNLTIRGVGGSRAILDANYTCLSNQGLFILSGSSNVTVENLEFRNCQGASGGNACGIRIVGKNVTIRNCCFYNNEDGIMGNPSTSSGSSVLIENSEFNYNGWGDLGYTHNIYIGPYETFTMRYSWSHNAHVGHEVKTRALTNYILYNRIGNEAMNPDGRNASYEIDVPQAGLTYIIGNQVHQGPYTENSIIITYAEESTANPDQHLYVVNNTIVNQRGAGTFVKNAGSVTALVQDNIFQGTGTTTSGLVTSLNNWVTNNAFLANVGIYDFHLTASSTGAINLGGVPNPSTGANGFSLIPDSQHVHPLSYEARPVRSTIDIGAYEYAPNIAPTVDAGTNQTITLPASANLDGTVTDDGLPNPPAAVSVTWSKSSGPGTVTFGNASAVDTTATFSVAGTYVLQLQATDSVLSAADTVTVTVNPKPNSPPTVNAGTDQKVIEGQAVQLHAAASDPDSDPLSYAWTQPAGLNVVLAGGASANASFTAPTVDTLAQAAMTFTVTVSDGKGGIAIDSVNVRVYLLGDVNQDDSVDVIDLLSFVAAFGGVAGDGNYDPACDFNTDGTVDAVDLLDLVDNFGRSLS